jgi:hypothetical protein
MRGIFSAPVLNWDQQGYQKLELLKAYRKTSQN